MQKAHLLATVFIGAALVQGGAATAQQPGATAPPETGVQMPAPTIEQTGRNTSTAYSQPGKAPGAMIAPNEVLVTEILGEAVYASRVEEEEIAVVEDAILDHDGRLKGVIIAANETYGVEGNRYVIPLERLSFDTAVDDEMRISTDISQEELTGAPNYGAAPQALAEGAADELYETPREARVARLTRQRELADGAQNIGAEIRTQAAIAESGEGEAREVERGLIASRSIEDAPADVKATGSISPADYGEVVDVGSLTADALIDAPVMAGSGDVIGKAEDVLFTDEGVAEAVLLDVGGFLGIGETRVALPLDKAEIVKGSEGGYALFTQLTEDDLREMKPHEAD